jgi:hypothetical protein
MIFLGFAVCALLAAGMTLIPQVNRTLTAYEKLGDTLNQELAPTLQEVRKVVVGVGELKQMAGQTMNGMSTKVEDVTGNISHLASTAKHQSSVWSTGFLAGAKAWLDNKEEVKKEHRPSNDGKQIAMDRGEENVGLKR